MARYDSDREDSAVDVESDAGSFKAGTDEVTPLLPTDLPAEIVPDKSFQRRVIGLCALLLFIVEIAQYLLDPSMQAIMEDIICRNQFPDHHLNAPSVLDNRCKDKDVQKTMAMVRSWIMTVELLIPLFVQVPYGIIADKYGRKPVLFLSVFGIVLQVGWILTVLHFPDVFSIWATIYGNIAYFIGGGSPMAGAMIWTLLADAVPVASRTRVFYLIAAMGPVLSVSFKPVAGLMLSVDPWLGIWIGFGALVLCLVPCAFMPETLLLRQKADDKRRREQPHGDIVNQAPGDGGAELTRETVLKRIWFAVKNDVGHIWRFIFASRSIVTLIIAFGAFYPVKIAYMINILQYMTKRFDWTWSTATYISAIGSLTSAVVLLAIMPAASSLLTKRYGYGPVARDLLLTRWSIVFVTAGTLLVSLAGVRWLFIVALVVYNMGIGFSVLCRALLNAVVEPHTVGTLNTTISTVEAFMGLISVPTMGWLFSKGLDLGGMWMGMPYMVTFVISGVVLLASFGFRIPAGVAQG